MVQLLLIAACAQSEAPKPDMAAAPAGPNVVEVGATDYAFQAPDTLPAGPTLFRLTDNGAEPHHIQLIRLEEGKTLQDMMALPPEAPKPWAVDIGGPNSPRPGGGVSETAVTLTPGNYAMICGIPSPAPDGRPHVMKGMMKAITVVESAEARAMPEADLTLTMNDFSFALSGPVSAGKHVVKVSNIGAQVHEVLFMRLAPGKSVKDVADWVMSGMATPPPGEPFGGTTGITAGGENLVMADFSPGEYGMLCFMPDPKDGRPHIALGMMSQFTVQ
jgi:hypothetical protein